MFSANVIYFMVQYGGFSSRIHVYILTRKKERLGVYMTWKQKEELFGGGGNQQEMETGLARWLKCPRLDSLLEKAPVEIVLHPTCLFSGFLQGVWFGFEVSTVVTLSQTLETFTRVLGVAWVHRGIVCYFQTADWWTNTLGDGRAASLESSDGMGCSGAQAMLWVQRT